MAETAPRALLLSIGSELLIGETVDTNAAHLGRELARLGVEEVRHGHLALCARLRTSVFSITAAKRIAPWNV